MVSKRSFGIVISASTLSRSVDAFVGGPPAPVALEIERRVTTPTVNAPAVLAILAMIGDAPVPVPPPMPAVMKTMSASDASR